MSTKKRRPKRIAFGGQKGGCGKTTLAASLAEWLLQHGRDFRLLEGNPGQQSLRRWAEIREQNQVEPPLVAVTTFEIIGQQLHDHTAELLQAPYGGITLLDLPGRIDAEIKPALLHCDAFVIPLPPRFYDYSSLREVVDLLAAAQGLRQQRGTMPLETYVVLNCTRRSKAQEVLRPQILREAPLLGLKVCRTEISDANDHFTASMVGRSVVSFAPSSKAAQQIDALARELGL